MRELIENYWKVISRTRKSGKISSSVRERVEASWKSFDEDVIEEALRIHINRYPTYKESYTIGIMRNLQQQKQEGKTVKKKNSFTPKMQTDYNFEELEKQLLNN